MFGEECRFTSRWRYLRRPNVYSDRQWYAEFGVELFNDNFSRKWVCQSSGSAEPWEDIVHLTGSAV